VVELVPLPLVLAANWFVGKPWGERAAAMLAVSTVLLLGLFGFFDLAGMPVLTSAGLTAQARFGVDAGTIVTAVAAAGFIFKPIRKDLSAVLPIDPDNPVHLMALVLATILLGTQVTSIAFTDVLAANNAQPPLSVLDLVEDELPFLIVAVAGVGLFVRRNAPASLERLGLVVPKWWHIALALAAAGLFFAFAAQMDVLSHGLTPQIARRVDATTQHLFGRLNTPIGIVALALLPGLCEEILFRGALQPRIGIIATALLFASIHTEYGFSLDTLAVLVIAIGLGLIRKYTNTTASCTCHVSYNLLVGFGITGLVLDAAIAIELILIGATAYAVWSNRRRAAAAP
jgi:CAAX protease family protein